MRRSREADRSSSNDDDGKLAVHGATPFIFKNLDA
jgi:hypothetical protein